MTKERVYKTPYTPYLVILGMLGLLAGFAVFIAGCGGDGMDGADVLPLLDPQIQAMDGRLTSHVETVKGILTDGAGSGSAAFHPSSGGPETEQQDSLWVRLRAEEEEYGREMHAMMNSLGETVALVGDCRMMMGGAPIGPDGASGTCPCSPYLDASAAELDRHLSEMAAWMESEDPSGIPHEMETHRQSMGSQLAEMRASMRLLHGSGGWMGGMH